MNIDKYRDNKTEVNGFVKNKGGKSTRLTILSKANDMISEFGMTDFRIDNLSKLLSLSPGNITYHFPKKEDISTALWDDVIENIPVIYSNHFTPLFDIKQLFLLLRAIFIENYKYRGVIAYKLGDMAVLKRTVLLNDNNLYKNVSTVFYDMLCVLNKNGYIKEYSKESIRSEHDLIIGLLFWFFINESLKGNEKDDVNLMAHDYGVTVIYPLVNMMTERGIVQFNDILNTQHSYQRSDDPNLITCAL